MILKADISKTSPARHLFLFIFMCGNSKCTRIQKIKNFSGEVSWVPLALKDSKNDGQTQKLGILVRFRSLSMAIFGERAVHSAGRVFSLYLVYLLF